MSSRAKQSVSLHGMLEVIDACAPALAWENKMNPSGKLTREACLKMYDECPDGAWLVWLAQECELNIRWLAMATAVVVKSAAHHESHKRLREATFEMAELTMQWARAGSRKQQRIQNEQAVICRQVERDVDWPERSSGIWSATKHLEWLCEGQIHDAHECVETVRVRVASFMVDEGVARTGTIACDLMGAQIAERVRAVIPFKMLWAELQKMGNEFSSSTERFAWMNEVRSDG